MPVSKRTRFEVLRRDGHRCRYCGAKTADGARLTVDHVTPVALGGTDIPGNLVAACVDCNAGKTSTSPDSATVAQVSDDALRWAAAMRQASAERVEASEASEAVEDDFRTLWTAWRPTPERNRIQELQDRAQAILAAEEPAETKPHADRCTCGDSEECPFDDGIECALAEARITGYEQGYTKGIEHGRKQPLWHLHQTVDYGYDKCVAITREMSATWPDAADDFQVWAR